MVIGFMFVFYMVGVFDILFGVFLFFWLIKGV